MPDITKCMNEKCKIKNDCYRYTSEDSYRQSYARFDEKDCGNFWDKRLKEKGAGIGIFSF